MKAVYIIFILTLVFFDSLGQERAFESAISESRREIKLAIDSLQLPGVAVTVYSGGRVWSEGFGYCDLESHAPVIPEISMFRIGSISKTLTAAALARLYEQDLLDLDADLEFYYPEFPDKGYPISIKQLAGHLAGIRHYWGNEFLNTTRYKSVQAGLEIFKHDPLLFSPGERYSYSSYGWNLLSLVIEKISERSYLEFMQDSVFSILEMGHTQPDYAEVITPGRVRFYQIANGELINSPFVDNSYKWAGGGFLSTSTDLLKFARAHLDHTFVKESTLHTFTSSLATNDGQETGYGLGWRTAFDKKGRSWIGHGGGSVGGTSMMMLYPEQQVIVIVLTNLSQANIGNLATEIANVFMN
ncbi:MAG: beta-lactamase family protein [Saprospiraceae bacterium]|nr:beta-lactamase family protein [Saprospiraceae bacterium]